MSDGERIAILETLAKEAAKGRESIIRKLDDQDDVIAATKDTVEEIRTQISGYQGFLKGAMFMLTLLGGVVGAALMIVWRKLFG